MKPDAPDDIRGEFNPIATRTPGLQICEHLPLLAERSELWSLVPLADAPVQRTLGWGITSCSPGRSEAAGGLRRLSKPQGQRLARRSPRWRRGLADRATTCRRPWCCPKVLIHRDGPRDSRPVRRRDGLRSAIRGSSRPRRFSPTSYGAFPEYGFHHATRQMNPQARDFQAPNLTLPEGMDPRPRSIGGWSCWTRHRDQQAACWNAIAETETFDRYRQRAISLLGRCRDASAPSTSTNADPQGARSLRPQHVRLVAADGAATGRGGRATWCR